jgi:uncharacterized lipoprotein YajG
MKIILAVISAAILVGCMTVPSTRITVDPVTKSIDVQSPKDIDIKGFRADFHPTATGTVVSVWIDSYTSKNNIDVIKAVAERNAAMQEALTKEGKELLGSIIDSAK